MTPGVHQPTFLWEMVVKQETWDALPDDLKPKLEAAAQLTTLQALTHFYDQDIKAMEQFRGTNVEIIALDPAFVEELSAAGRDWIAKKAEAEATAGKPEMKDVLTNYTDFQNRWSAESGYLIRNQN